MKYRWAEEGGQSYYDFDNIKTERKKNDLIILKRPYRREYFVKPNFSNHKRTQTFHFESSFW